VLCFGVKLLTAARNDGSTIKNRLLTNPASYAGYFNLHPVVIHDKLALYPMN